MIEDMVELSELTNFLDSNEAGDILSDYQSALDILRSLLESQKGRSV